MDRTLLDSPGKPDFPGADPRYARRDSWMRSLVFWSRLGRPPQFARPTEDESPALLDPAPFWSDPPNLRSDRHVHEVFRMKGYYSGSNLTVGAALCRDPYEQSRHIAAPTKNYPITISTNNL